MKLVCVFIANILLLASAAEAQTNPLGDPQTEGPSPAEEARSQTTPTQTVEGARRFLQELVARGTIGLWFGHYTENYFGDEVAHGPITKMVESGPCQVALEATMLTNTFNNKTFRPLILDFSKVEQFKVSARFDTWIDISPPRMGPEGYQNVLYASSAMAPRVVYALEFIRNSCDPTTATGF